MGQEEMGGGFADFKLGSWEPEEPVSSPLM